ncbi:MAG: glycosyltransferase family 2 protein, partial [Candidatus Acidiferrales bacterium]
PLVSVIVLNYKRIHELERCLDSIVTQDYPNIEAIVVDNYSEEDVASVVRTRDATMRLIELPANLGPCCGRNAGIREAHGQIIVTLDNDVSFLSPFELSKVVKAFEEHPEIHILAFRICDAGTGRLRVREWCHPRDWQEFGEKEFETSFFGEGASAFRREVFDVAGLYWEPLFIGHEGYDLGLRLLDSGYRILYCPIVAVAHSMSRETRSKSRPFYYYTRNYIWVAYKDHGFRQGIHYLVPKLLMMLFFSLRAWCLMPFVRGIWDGVRGLKRIKPRTPIRRTTLIYLADLERQRPTWWRRLGRHRLEPQL